MVDDIIMPVITIFTGKMDFSELTFTLGNSSIKYGSFITAVINFLIIAFSIFLFVRYMNKLNKKLETITEEEIKKSVNYQWAKIILNIFEKVGLNGWKEY